MVPDIIFRTPHISTLYINDNIKTTYTFSNGFSITKKLRGPSIDSGNCVNIYSNSECIMIHEGKISHIYIMI
jgi:hypothetical protein